MKCTLLVLCAVAASLVLSPRLSVALPMDSVHASEPVAASDSLAAPAIPDHVVPSMHWASYDRVTFDGTPPNTETHVRPIPFAVTATLYGGAIVGLHLYQANAWWSKDRRSFHFSEDWPENLQNDKFGHFFGAYINSYMMREAMIESGLSDADAHNWASILGAVYSLYVEVEDGFASSWGFSPTDAYADIAGGGFFLAQRYVPFLQNFHEKWSYWPSKFLGSGSIPGQQRTVFDDYQGQSYWWSVDVWNMLPASAQAWWPKWLQVAVGYTARKYGPYLGTAAPPGSPASVDLPDTREVSIGLDYSFPNLIPKTHIPVIDWFVQTLDFFHFPAPTLRLSPTVQGYLLYPIQFRIGNVNF